MARTIHPAATPDTAPAGADGAPDAGPATDTPAPGNGPAAAVMTALTALKGAAVADIARHAGVSVPDARKALIGFEKAGTATREKGARPGIPDTWKPAPAPQDRDDEPDEPEGPEDEPDAATADDAPAGEAAPGDETADSVGTDATGDTVTPDSGDGDPAEPAGADETVGATADADDADDGDGSETGRPDEQSAEPAPEDTQDTPAPDTAEEPADGEPAEGADGAGDPPDSAAIAEASEQVLVIAQAIADIGTALAAGRTGDALAAIEAIREPAAQARRVLKAATRKRGSGSARGTRAASPRPGALRDLVEQHLYKFPDKEFTAHDIGKVIVRSSGAIANALDRLTELGVAELSHEKPRRFRLRPDAPARPDLTGDASQPGAKTDPGSETAPATEPAPEPEPETSPEAETAPAPAGATAPDQEPGDEPEPAPETGAGAETAITAGAA